MKLFAPFVYLYYFIRGIFTSPLYAWRRTKSFYGRKRSPEKKRNDVPSPIFVDENGNAKSFDGKRRRRRGHRGGRKHKKNRGGSC